MIRNIKHLKNEIFCYCDCFGNNRLEKGKSMSIDISDSLDIFVLFKFNFEISTSLCFSSIVIANKRVLISIKYVVKPEIAFSS